MCSPRVMSLCVSLSGCFALGGCFFLQPFASGDVEPLRATNAGDYSMVVDWLDGQLTFALDAIQTGTCRALARDANITVNGARLQVTPATWGDMVCINNLLEFDGSLDVREPLVVRFEDSTGVAEFVTTHPRAPRTAQLVAPEDGRLRPGEPVEFVWTPATDVLVSPTFIIQTARSGPHRVELRQGPGGVLTGVQPDLSWLPTQEASTQVLAQGHGGVIRCTFGSCAAPPAFTGPPAFMMTVGQ